MSGQISHFAIYAAAPEAVMAFYATVFGWTFEPWGPPGYWNIQTPGTKGTTFGALTQRDVDPEPGTPNAYRCSIATDDLDATDTVIQAAGGTRVSTTIDIPGVGRVAEYRDPASNLFCAIQYVAGHPLS